MAAFGEDFDLQAFKEAFDSQEDMEAYNRAQALERAVGRVQNYVAEPGHRWRSARTVAASTDER